MKTTIDNPKYRRILNPQSSADWIEYLDFMTDFYFKVMLALRNVSHKTQFRAQMATSLQMMFTKGKSMRCLLNGYSQENESVLLRSKADHTILFTLVRSAFEQLCAFELVYMIPDTPDKRTIMENVYVAAAQVNRLKMFTEEGLAQYSEKTEIVKRDIEACRKDIYNSQLYQSLTEKEKAEFEKTVFKRGEYQIVFTKEGRLIPHVGWDEVRDYCRLRTDVLHGVYKFACNMAHPSYLGLCQFNDAYQDNEIDNLNDTAVMQMIAVMSVYIIDFMEEFLEAKCVYDAFDDEAQFAVRMYSECFRKRSVD